VVTNKGKIIRTPVEGISVLGRNTQGVRIIRMGTDERVVALARMVDRDDEDVGESAEAPDDEGESEDAPSGDEG
jgi:DNA gyrase subunit A